MNGVLMMVLAVLCSAAASYCLKLGAANGASGGLLALALQPVMLAAMVCYAASFGAYALALQKIPLSLAQPAITAGVSILATLVAVALLGETMSAANWIGLALICVGIALLSAGKI